MLGFPKLRRNRQRRRRMQSRANDHATLDGEEMFRDRMIAIAESGLRGSMGPRLQFSRQLFSRQCRQSLPLPFKRLNTQPKQCARGRHNRADIYADIYKDGPAGERRNLKLHLAGSVPHRFPSKSHELSRTSGSPRGCRWMCTGELLPKIPSSTPRSRRA